MLDDQNVIKQRDPDGALTVAAQQCHQTTYEAVIQNAEHDQRPLARVVIAGMGGSALAALVAKAWLGDTLSVPFEVVRTYDLPAYVDTSTLVIASSYSGNTEETVSALNQAKERGAQIGIIASGGTLIDQATADTISHVRLPSGLQPRMAVIYNLKALLSLLVNFGVVEQRYLDEITNLSGWLEKESAAWNPEVGTEQNLAKQIALMSVGKTAVFYGGALTGPAAYKWRISWNENAKNVAYSNEYPEFNHNEFIGWTSHPVEKPFAIFDVISRFEHPQTLRRFEISDRLLSGRRPKATRIELAGETVLAQLLWSSILADYASIYLAILNGINPTPVDLIEKLKKEL